MGWRYGGSAFKCGLHVSLPYAFKPPPVAGVISSCLHKNWRELSPASLFRDIFSDDR